MAYYAHSALHHHRNFGSDLNFVVPTGNLGNAFAGLLAKAVGLPIGMIMLATNANRVLPEFLAGAPYSPSRSLATLANAMDVGAPSNFERLRWFQPDEGKLRATLAAESVSDEEIREAIATTHARFGVAICPHTATAARVLARLRERGVAGDWAIVTTAHPAKFESVVEPLAGPVEVPPALARLLTRPSRAEGLAVDYAAFRQRLANW